MELKIDLLEKLVQESLNNLEMFNEDMESEIETSLDASEEAADSQNDLISKLQAEIERLQAEIEKLKGREKKEDLMESGMNETIRIKRGRLQEIVVEEMQKARDNGLIK